MSRSYHIDILNPGFESRERFTSIMAAIQEAKWWANAHCCDVRVIRDDGDVIARVNHAFIDERNKFHRLSVDKYWKEDWKED